MHKILLIQGANMVWLGKREPEFYGTTTAAELDAIMLKEAKDRDLDITIRYTNVEGEAINWVYEVASGGADALYRSHFAVSGGGSQENPVTDLMKPGLCRAAFQARQQASIKSSTVSMTRLASKCRRNSCQSSSTGLSWGL